MKVLIADDWAIFRSGLQQILSQEFGRLEVTQLPPARKHLDRAPGPWDLALVSAGMGNPAGADFIAALQRAYPEQPVVAIAWRADIPHVERAFGGAIRGTLAKESTVDEVVTVLRKAYVPADSPNGMLSARELEVLRLIALGRSIKETAATLGISASTAGTHRVRMLRKLGMKSTAELIRYALEKPSVSDFSL